MSLKVRITRMFWIGNAVVCAILALLGGMMSFEGFGYDAQLSALAVRAGALLAATGAGLAAYSLWKARSTSSSR
ncbi:MAG: hypothetical protein ACLPH3_21225 [Terracidiphilus sp.]